MRRVAIAIVALLAVFARGPGTVTAQSLGEAARKEAERRKALSDVEGKVIHLEPSSDMVSAPSPRKASARDAPAKRNERLPGEVRKLDRQIRQLEDKLVLLRRRSAAERWAPPRTGRLTKAGNAESNAEKLKSEIEELEFRLKSMKAERQDAYNAARREGFLPGEIDGKGIVP